MVRSNMQGTYGQLRDAVANTQMSSCIKEQARQVDELETILSRLDAITCAMWELLQEQGVTKERLYDKLDEVIDKRKSGFSYFTRISCPRCGKAIQESNRTPLVGRCVYCGTQVTFYPYSDDYKLIDTDDEQVVEETPAPVSEQQDKPYSVADDLGF